MPRASCNYSKYETLNVKLELTPKSQSGRCKGKARSKLLITNLMGLLRCARNNDFYSSEGIQTLNQHVPAQ